MLSLPFYSSSISVYLVISILLFTPLLSLRVVYSPFSPDAVQPHLHRNLALGAKIPTYNAGELIRYYALHLLAEYYAVVQNPESTDHHRNPKLPSVLRSQAQ